MAEHAEDSLDFAKLTKTGMVLVYLHNAEHRAQIFGSGGKPGDVVGLSDGVTVLDVSARKDSDGFFIATQRFVHSGTRFAVTTHGSTLTLFERIYPPEGSRNIEAHTRQFWTKQVFDDLFAVPEKLIADGITTPGQLALHGRSNGGLLAGAALTPARSLNACWSTCVCEDSAMTRYLHGHAASVLASHAVRTAADSCGYLLPELRAGMRVLDIGSGPGTITCDLAALVGPEGLVVGVEPVAEALEAGRAEAARRGETRARFELGDVHDLAPLLERVGGPFDVVHAHQVLQHLPDPVAALRGMAAAAAPGALVAARDADYAEMSWWPHLPELERWRELYLAIARANGAHPDAARRMRGWANAAGLGGARYTTSTWTYATAELTAWWGGSWSVRALESRFAEEVLARGLADRGELGVISAAWREWGAHPDAVFTMVHGELLAAKPAC